jgi:hypothetical protein
MADVWTLGDLLVAVRRGLRDGWTGAATAAGTATTLVCARFAWGSNNAWLGSEIFFLAPPNATDLNPVTVTGFVAATGTFTFAGQNITPTTPGQTFLLGNQEGQGWTHAEVLDAIQTAIARRRAGAQLTDATTLTYAAPAREYAVPAAFADVRAVEYLAPGGTGDQWLPIARRYWSWDRERRMLRLGYHGVIRIPVGSKLLLRGTATPTAPLAPTDTALGDGATIRDDALYEQLLASKDPLDRQRAAALGGGVLRARGGAALARL